MIPDLTPAQWRALGALIDALATERMAVLHALRHVKGEPDLTERTREAIDALDVHALALRVRL